MLNYKTIGIIAASVVTAAGFLFRRLSSKIPQKATAIKHFDINRYMGKWYEIARFDFKFERYMNNTTANYSLQDDGTVKVVNRGFNYKTNKWKEAVGKAKFRDDANEAKLKVSFFGPFYSPYNVIALDDEYRFALIAGKNLDYIWILSREKNIPENIKQSYVAKAKSIGYDTSLFVWIKHN